MKGGLLSRVDTSRTMDDQMLFILSNSTIEVLSHGRYGFACKVTMNQEDSGFIDEDENPVTTFIIKLVPLDMRMAHKDGKWSSQSTIEKLQDEVSLQSHVYRESLRKHAYSPYPALLHYLVYTVGQLNTLLPGEFSYKVGETEVHDETLRLGVIFMEFSSSQGTLFDAVKRGETTLEEKQGEATRLYCMALECGVNHRDAHANNFLIDHKGQLKLIDFGLARQLTEKEKEVVPLIPRTASDDCEELRVKLQALYKPDAWFLREPFSIDSYTTKVAKKAVKRCAKGLCEIEPEKRQAETKAYAPRERIRLEREYAPKEGPEERIQRLERESRAPREVTKREMEGTTELEKRRARERREDEKKRAIRFLLDNHREAIKNMSLEELDDLIEEVRAEIRRQDELDTLSSGGRRTRKVKKKRTRRKYKVLLYGINT
jgi:thiamine kinase-like enzyme